MVSDVTIILCGKTDIMIPVLPYSIEFAGCMSQATLQSNQVGKLPAAAANQLLTLFRTPGPHLAYSEGPTLMRIL